MINFLVNGPFSITVKSSKNFTMLSRKIKENQLTLFMLTTLNGLLGILHFLNNLVYTLLPSVWHWGFESTTTWQDPTIHWDGFKSAQYSNYLILAD